MDSSVEKMEGPNPSQEESPVDVQAKRWLEHFLKTETGTDYTDRLIEMVGFWSSKFQDEKYENFVCNRASIGFLCRALAENLRSVDPKTPFGKQWTSVVKVCVPLLEQLRTICDEFDPGDVKLEYGRYSDIDLYLEVFVEPKDPPKGKHGRTDHGSESLTKAHVPTLVKELLQRVRHFSQSIPRRRRQSEVTQRFTTAIQSLTGSRDKYGWLPDQVEVTFEHKDGTKGRRYEEPFFHVCLNYVRAAQLAGRLNKHRNGVDSTVSVQGSTKRVSRPVTDGSDRKPTTRTTNSKDFAEVKRKGKVGKHAGNPNRDRSKYDKNKERNDQRKAEKAEASKPMPQNQWDERRLETLRKQMTEAQLEIEKLEKKKPSTSPKEETLDDFVEEVAGPSN